MKEGFYITVKDNFFDDDTFKQLKNTLPTLNYSGSKNLLVTDTKYSKHPWFSVKAENNISEIIRKESEKLLNKKFKTFLCSYTLVSTAEPLPHCDLSNDCDYQIIIYIKGNQNLHKGTGFYIYNEHNNTSELNTHIGFRENRAVVWHSNSLHTPMNWASDDKSKRFSIISQLKQIK